MSGVTGNAVLVSPMPRPRAKGAPRFKGKRVKEFLEEFEELATACGIDKARLPKLVVRYCSSKVADVIRYRDVFGGQDWDKATAELITLYESSDQRPHATAVEFRQLTNKSSALSRFASRRELDEYVREFMRISGDLVKRGQLTVTKRNLRFYQGLPSSDRNKIRPQLTSTDRDKPDDMDKVLPLVRALYQENDIDMVSDDEKEKHLEPSESEASDQSDGDESDEDSDADPRRPPPPRAKSSKKSTKSKAEATPKATVPIDPIAEITSSMDKLTLAIANGFSTLR